jgi:polyferredoxin
VALKAAPGLVLLAAAALLVPWSTRRQIYCHQICPHGAAQQLLLLRCRWTPPARLAQALEYIPGVLLAFALLTLLLGWQVNLAALEPFDA